MSAAFNTHLASSDLPLIDGKPWPIVRYFTLQQWRDFPAFPGHRNSEKRAARANHLFTLQPEHVVVEAARLVDQHGKSITNPEGEEIIYRLTGNTRVAVWEKLLSDQVPPCVMATVYTCHSLDEIVNLGSHFDSRQAAWTATDQAYRANGMAFHDEWRPSSSTFKNKASSLFSALRRADAIAHGHLHGEAASHNDAILPKWLEEYRLLDSIMESNVVKSIERKNHDQAHVLAAIFLLLRVDNPELVRKFFLLVFSDHGYRDGDGYDGVQVAIESIYPSGRGARNFEMTDHIVGAYLLWRDNKRAKTAELPPMDIREWFATSLLKKARSAS